MDGAASATNDAPISTMVYRTTVSSSASQPSSAIASWENAWSGRQGVRPWAASLVEEASIGTLGLSLRVYRAIIRDALARRKRGRHSIE